ncbi:MAG: tetratricopeptide repeat protein [Gemmatimonadetes bacterium]|jgi:Tfp pilus assembly protein PilF|nr:tetratricopeptide repeat protein [Gemmatimonadota bacterium]
MADQDKISLYKSGMGKYAQQDFTGALEDFTNALEIDPEFADVHQSMAHCHEQLGDFDAALACAQRAVELNPDDFLAHTSLSIFYQRKGMVPEAEREKGIAAQLQSP